MERVVLHCDCNSFFASVECMLDPSLKKFPVAVCGNEEERRGIVLAKNEAAKAYGIKTAETVWSAKRKCPQLVVVPPHYDEYVRVSGLVNKIYRRYTDLVEPFGIDEAWLDVTGSRKLFGSGEEIAERLRREIKDEIGITVSVGVSFNKVFAKLGSDYKKPDAVTVISRENFKEIVYPMSVDALLYVGSKTSDSLKSLGIKTIGNLANTDLKYLQYKFGKHGEMLFHYARGDDDSPVASVYDKHDPKSISNGMTFKKDISTDDEIKLGLDFLCDEIGERLRRNGKKCCGVCVTMKDTYLVNLSRQKQINPPTSISSEISALAFQIVKEQWLTGKPIRMLTVAAINLINEDEETTQIDLFADVNHEKRNKAVNLETAIDKIKDKFGKSSISRAGYIQNEIGIHSDEKRKTDK